MSYIKYPRLTPEECKAQNSEVAKYRSEFVKYCEGAGVDVASQGVPCVPWAISFDLPPDEALRYTGGVPPKGPVHLHGHADALPFSSNSLDWVLSSELIEDFPKDERKRLIAEWARCVKRGGYVIVLGPDCDRWQEAVRNGQPPNVWHSYPEPRPGELAADARQLGLEVVEDRFTDIYPGDYTMLLVLRKP